jgi:protein gp37
MGEITGIAWCDHTFNPWIGCTKVHTGCKGCYAEALATTRLGREWGPGAERRSTSAANWRLPYRWAKAAAKAGVRRRVFCASLADVLDEEAPTEAQARLWQVIRDTAPEAHPRCGAGAEHVASACPRGVHAHVPGLMGGLDWLLLTKRPERWALIPEDVRRLVWFGTSISDQETADQWILRLLTAEGFRLLWLSVEPQIGPISFNRCTAWDPNEHSFYLEGISWVVVGGESSQGRHQARPYDLKWPRGLLAECRAAGVPFFHKQLGDAPVEMETAHDVRRDWDSPIRAHHGADPAEWPEDLRVREFPTFTAA